MTLDLNPRPYLLNIDGKKVEAAVTYDNERFPAGVSSFGKDAMPYVQLVLIKQALQLPANMKFSRHTPAGTTMARKWLGLKGNKASLLKQVEAIISLVDKERAAYHRALGFEAAVKADTED